MEAKALKKIFSEIGERNGFKKGYGALYMESKETVVTLNLQKSNFGNYFDLNIKIFVQGLFGRSYDSVANNDLANKEIGNVFLRPPKVYECALNLDLPIRTEDREKQLASCISDFVSPIARSAGTRSDLLLLGEAGKVHLLPAVRAALLGRA